MNIKKVNVICDIMDVLERDSTASALVGKLQKITYAPNLGYRNWIFKYCGVYLLLYDIGNGHYEYLCPVSCVDMIYAKIYHKLDVWGILK